MKNLKGKSAIVIGAANKKSMGRAVAVQLAADGADVAIVDIAAKPESIWPGDEGWLGLEDVAEEIKAQGQEALIIEADVSNSNDVDAIVSKTMERFGKIDILVNCVGVRGPVPVPIVELEEKTWRMLIDINLTGVFLISKAVAKTMIPDGEGKKNRSYRLTGCPPGIPGRGRLLRRQIWCYRAGQIIGSRAGALQHQCQCRESGCL